MIISQKGGHNDVIAFKRRSCGFVCCGFFALILVHKSDIINCYCSSLVDKTCNHTSSAMKSIDFTCLFLCTSPTMYLFISSNN